MYFLSLSSGEWPEKQDRVCRRSSYPEARSLGRKRPKGGTLSGSLPFLRTSICTMGWLSLQARPNKRQGEWPRLTPRIHKDQCALAQAVPHHEGLPRLACPRVPGLLPPIPSLGPSLEGQRMWSEETQGPQPVLLCIHQTQLATGLGRQKATLKSGSVLTLALLTVKVQATRALTAKQGAHFWMGPLS